MIPYAEWLPDQADLNNPGATVAKNVRPHAMGYVPLPSLELYSAAMTARPQGGFYARDSGDVAYTYAGDANRLWVLDSGAWTDVSRTAAYTTPTNGYWEFVKWNEDIITTNYANEMQKITMGGAEYQDLAGAPPKARHLAVVRNFLVAGNTNDVDGEIPNRVRWSAADDEESWTVSAATQADKEDLYGPGGWIHRVWGGEYGVIMQEQSIWRMSYIGSPAIFQFDEVLPGHGIIAPGACAQHGDHIFFLSDDGFEVLENGSAARMIGANKVDQFVLSDLDLSYRDRIKSAVDPRNKHWYFAYPGASNVSGRPNRLMIYDWSTGRWSYGEVNIHLLIHSATGAYTLDGLDSVSTSLDAISISLDDPIWKGGPPELAAWGANLAASLFTGDPMDATLETTELQINPGRRTLVNAVRPLIDGGTSTVQIGKRQAQADSVEWSMTASVRTSGRATLRSNARYHRFRTSITGTWTHAQGVDVSGDAQGWR